MALILFWLLFIGVIGISSGNESLVLNDTQVNIVDDDPLCNHHIHKFYRGLECRPETTPNVKCPTSYDCPFMKDRKPDRCYFKNESYPIGAYLTNSMLGVSEVCTMSCQCKADNLGGAKFVCAKETRKTCPVPPGCKHFYFVTDPPCCDKGVISCPKEKQERVKCEFEGRSYSEGKMFFPGEDMSCTQCICAAGFNGTISAPFCRQFPCVLELSGDTLEKLTKGCIPVYLSEKGCCPQSFRCPKPSDQVVKPVTKISYPINTEEKCQFGNLTMEVGDELSPWKGDDELAKKMVCTCRVPPVPSCVQKDFFAPVEFVREFFHESPTATPENKH